MMYGFIDSVDNMRISNTASWDGIKWDSLGTGLWNGPAGAMAVYNNEMYIGGGFLLMMAHGLNYTIMFYAGMG